MSEPPTTPQTLTIDQAIELALSQHQAGHIAQAESIYQQVLKLAPEHPMALQYLGVVTYQRGQFDEAEKLMLRSMELLPDQPGFHNNLGEVYRAVRRFDQAQAMFEKTLQLNPSDYHATNNLALSHMDQNQNEQALPLLETAIRLMPENATAYCNLGVVQERLGRFEEALQTLETSSRLDPRLAAAHINRSSVLNALERIDDALTAADTALGLAPADATAHLSRSNALFHSGRLKEAWPEYEWRLQKYTFLVRNFLEPQWDGTDLKGKTILLYCEQGFGDAIMFARYAKLVAQRGAGRVILECPPALAPLLTTAEGVNEVVPPGQFLPQFDVRCSMLRLPGAFETELSTIPNQTPYLKVDDERMKHWTERVRADGKPRLRVGLAWAGSSAHEKDRLRSCGLADFVPLAGIDGVQLYSLQKGIPSEQAFEPPAGMKLIDHTLILTDFAEAAALVNTLDLVISVDTATAHLAGALGKPIWTMLPLVPEWRWMRCREDSPWYPTMRLFRQTKFRDWSDPIDRIAQTLREMLSSTR